MSVNINVDGIVKKVKDIFIDINEEKKKVKSIFVNAEGIVKKVYDNFVDLFSKAMIVGTQGKIIISSNGVNWETKRTHLGETKDSNYIFVYNGAQYVAFGTSMNFVYFSSDKLDWTKHNIITYNDELNLNYYFTDIVYGNNKYVAIVSKQQEGNCTYYSENGINWFKTEDNAMGSTKFLIGGIAFGNNTFVCVGQFGKVYYSNDGIKWTSGYEFTKTYLSSIAFGNGYFSVDYVDSTQQYPNIIRWSSNGGVWNLGTQSTHGSRSALTFVGNYFLCLEESQNMSYINYSSNGKSYYDVSRMLDQNSYIYDFGYNSNDNSYIALLSSGLFYYSLNGFNTTQWTKSTTPLLGSVGLNKLYNCNKFIMGITQKGNFYYDIAYNSFEKGYDFKINQGVYYSLFANNKFMILDQNGIGYSTEDGENFNTESYKIPENNKIHQFLFVNNTYFLVERIDSPLSYEIFYGTDLSNMKKSIVTDNRMSLSKIIYIDTMNMYIGLKRGEHITKALFYSVDGGASWNPYDTGLSVDTSIYGMAFGNDSFVILGNKTIYIKKEIRWYSHSYEVTNSYINLYYLNRIFVLISNLIIYVSTDGLNFYKKGLLKSSEDIIGLIYKFNKYILLGRKGNLYYSTDGEIWTAGSSLGSNITYYNLISN